MRGVVTADVATAIGPNRGPSPGSIDVVDNEVQQKSVPTVLAVIGLLAAGVPLGGIALVVGGDRLVDCGSLRGLNALMGDNMNHVDGPAGGGGCMVPTTAAWTAAIVAALAPLAIWLLVRRNTRPG